MTVSYSLSVSKASFGGFARLLFRWKGSIYKILWRELVLFCILFVLLQVLLRHCLTSQEKLACVPIIDFVKSFSTNVPYSFVLGFFVSCVISRFTNQASSIPWPDRVAHLIASYVHGSDERSRVIRRTLGRYVILQQVLTFQTVSTAVKRRFPTTRHLVEAGIMTAEERSVYEKMDFSYGKWWFPTLWFTGLATRAKKEGRIKDSVLLNSLIKEFQDYKTFCAMTISYDLIGIPLAYTQVATITTYLYSLILLIGYQTLDVPDGQVMFADYYFPFVSVWSFFFSVGWLKVASQLLNPYGEDDDDFELNWFIDRGVSMVYKTVDEYHLMHPKVKKDAFWDVENIVLPQTEHSAKYMRNPDMGSAYKLQIDEVEYLPIDELCEKDEESNMYKNESIKKKTADRQNSSFIRRVMNSGFGTGSRKKSLKTAARRTQSCKQGLFNPAFSTSDENVPSTSIPIQSQNKPEETAKTRHSSLRNLVKKISPSGRKNSAKLKSKSLSLKSRKSNESEDAKMNIVANEVTQEESFDENEAGCSTKLKEPVEMYEVDCGRPESPTGFESNPEDQGIDVLMPSIPEEFSRANSLASIELKGAIQRGEIFSHQIDKAYDIVKGASEALREISEAASTQERWTANEGKGYESCCSGVNSEESPDNSSDEHESSEEDMDKKKVVVTIEDSPHQKDLSKKPVERK